MAILELSLPSGDSALSICRFSVRDAVSSPFSVSLWARSPDPGLDLGTLVGETATFRAVAGYAHVAAGSARQWRGMINYAEQLHALQPGPGGTGVSTYYIRLVPTLWLLTQRRGNRIFQHLTIPDILDRLLAEWQIMPTWRIDRSRYPRLEYKVQYAETDYEFFSRILEEAGIAFTFANDGASTLVLSDHLEAGEPRPGLPLSYVDSPNEAAEQEFVTDVRLAREVHPGAATLRDHDFRRPRFALFGESPRAPSPEDRLEQYHYRQGAFLAETGKAEGTPAADDQGFARHDQRYGTALAEITSRGDRRDARKVSFEANTFDVSPGVIISIDNHPHPDIGPGRKLLVVESSFEGTPEGSWTLSGSAVFADAPYRPRRRTRKPVVGGLQSAIVVGPPGQEIHTDEFGRIRVQFHWDREGKKNEHSSCWIRVHQAWSGAGWGTIVLPRVGQEVLISFHQGDPDQPIVVGRAYNAIQQVPYRLPEHKTRSTWKSDSSLGDAGFNEIMFEDLKGKELVWQHAERDRARLVKSHESATVVRDRQKLVKNDESDHTDGKRQCWVGMDADVITVGHHRERIDVDAHLEVRGNLSELTVGKQSSSVLKDRKEQVGGRYAIRAKQQVHYVAGEEYVAEGHDDVTLKGAGGFIRIGEGGITIQGTLVRINVGGSPGKGKGSKPEPPDEALLEPEAHGFRDDQEGDDDGKKVAGAIAAGAVAGAVAGAALAPPWPPGKVAHKKPPDADALIQKYLAVNAKDAISAGRKIEGYASVVGDEDWDKAGVAHYGEKKWKDEKRDRLNGFVDRNGKVWIHKDRGDPATMIHEGIHKYSDRALIMQSQPLNEGVTEYYTRYIAGKEEIAKTRKTYQPNYRFAEKLAKLVGEDKLDKAYFDGDVSQLKEAVDAKQGSGTWSSVVTLSSDDKWSEASKLLDPKSP